MAPHKRTSEYIVICFECCVSSEGELQVGMRTAVTVLQGNRYILIIERSRIYGNLTVPNED